MSIREVTYYQIECDYPGCDFATGDNGSEYYSAWDSAGGAEGEWRYDGGITADDGKHLCEEHSTEYMCLECGEDFSQPVPQRPDHDGERWCDKCVTGRDKPCKYLAPPARYYSGCATHNSRMSEHDTVCQRVTQWRDGR